MRRKKRKKKNVKKNNKIKKKEKEKIMALGESVLFLVSVLDRLKIIDRLPTKNKSVDYRIKNDGLLLLLTKSRSMTDLTQKT
jgi:hypothetical protein